MTEAMERDQATISPRAMTTLQELDAVTTSFDRAPDVAAAAQRVADELISSGRPDEATLVYRRLLEMARRVLGASHPMALTTLHNLAVLCDASGRASEAEALWAEARAAVAAQSGCDG